MISLEGQVVIVTGASEGLGRVLARAAVGAGAQVVLAARRVDRLQEVASDVGAALAVTCDVTVEDDRRRLLETAVTRLGAVDVLVNNAATAASGAAVEETPEVITRTIETNLTAVLRLSQIAAPIMLRQARGSIVNISSIAAMRSFDRFGLASYASSKAAVHGLTRELAAQWGPAGVRVNAVAPGWFPGGTNGYLADQGLRDWISSRTALRRPGRPEEVADAVLFLASDMSTYITGQVLAVDGGWTAY